MQEKFSSYNSPNRIPHLLFHLEKELYLNVTPNQAIATSTLEKFQTNEKCLNLSSPTGGQGALHSLRFGLLHCIDLVSPVH